MARTTVVGRVLVAVGVLTGLAALLGAVVGLRLLGQLDDALAASLDVTGQAVGALVDTVELADTTIDSVEASLRSSSSATDDLADALDDATLVLRSTADLTRDDVVGSLEAVRATMPALIDTAGVVDGTLRTLAVLPFGPDYAPEEPFDESLRGLEEQLADLPASVGEQADLLDDSAEDLARVADGAGQVATDLLGLADTLGEAGGVLERYATTAQEADALLATTRDDLGGSLAAARVLVVVLGIGLAAGQVVPVGLGWLLLHPDRRYGLLGGAG